MDITFGKRNIGKSVEIVMLNDPIHIKWVFDQRSPTGPLVGMKNHALKLEQIFDNKPFVEKKCAGDLCSRPATRFTVYQDNINPHWWCEDCDEYQHSAPRGKLISLSNYRSALKYVERYCRNRKSDYKQIIRVMAQGKGLPPRVGEKQAQIFFHG
jgi:hypothetical protein